MYQIATYCPYEPLLLESLSAMESSLKHDDMQGMNENLVEDEYHLLIACSTYKVIHKKYDDQLDKHDISSVILKYRCMHYFLLESKTPPFLRRSYMQDNMLIWSHRSNWLFY